MSDEKQQYLDADGVRVFSEAILNKVNEMLDERIVQSIKPDEIVNNEEESNNE